MEISLNLEKMPCVVDASGEVSYYFEHPEQKISVNSYLGKSLKLEFLSEINCVHCGKKTKTSFSQGYCYPCFLNLAQCDMCIMKPETCHFDKGTCREPEWAQTHCMIPHYVYLANSSGIKVGITRTNQIPTRWVDQGATWALPILEAKNRHHSGLLEVAISEFVPDKTAWQKMLKGEEIPVDLLQESHGLIDKVKELINKLDAKILAREKVYQFKYPVLEYPKKVSSHSFDKKTVVEGTLQGIKGQYLIFDTGVINIRKFTGYKVKIIGA